MQGALALWVRADWRRRKRALLALTLLVGVAGAVVLTATAGARRTATSFERLVERSLTADVLADVGAVDPDVVEEIRRLPIVEVSGEFTIIFAIVEGVEKDIAFWAPRDSRIGVVLERVQIVRGRRPDPASLDEAVVNETTAAIAGVDVGDAVDVYTLTPEQVANEVYDPPQGPRLRVQIVGVTKGPNDLEPGNDAGFVMSEAFLGSVRGQVDEWTTYLGVRLTEGVTVADFESAIGAMIPPGQEYELLPFEVRSKAAQGTISAVASGLMLFAIVAAAAAAVAVGQAVGRHVASARADEEMLGALGVTRSGRRAALALLAFPAAIGGAVIAVGAAWLASPLMPIGLARRAEPDSGFSADWSVFGIGAMAIIAVVLGSGAVAATWMTTARDPARSAPRPSTLATVIARAGAGPAAANGARLALDRRTPALPVRSAIVGVAVAILGIVAVLTFSASLERLLATPDRWGYGWDLTLDFTSENIDEGAAQVVGDDRLAAVARWDAGFSVVEGTAVRAFGLEPLAGDIGFALRSGRQPVSPAEVVVGPDTADRLGVHLGDQVRVASETGVPDPAEVVVVGIALFPDDDSGSLVDAIGYFGPAFAEHSIVPDLFEANSVVVRLAPGLDVDDVAAGLQRDHPGSITPGENLPTQPGEVAYLSGIRSLPRWLAAFVALLGIASLGHVLLTTRARRRAELATLRSLGLTPRQTVACIVWQAVTITLVGLAIGLPLGMIAGDTAWFAVADPIGVATDASKPVGAFCATALAALVVAGLVAIVPGWRASRLRPAESLRTE